MRYLREIDATITDVRTTDAPRYGWCRDGYSTTNGGATSWQIQINGDSRWRRVRCLIFSNIGRLIVRFAREDYAIDPGNENLISALGNGKDPVNNAVRFLTS